MTNKIIVIISEGGSEPSFINEFLKINYGFKNSELSGKGQEVISNGKIYVFFSHPVCNKGNYGIKGGGDSSIIDNKTYIKVKSLIKQYFSYLLEGLEIIYLIQTDINRKKEKEKSINDNILKFCPDGRIFISYASLMIETWFTYGIGNEFLKNYSIDAERYKQLLKNDINTLHNINNDLDIVLIPSGLSGARNSIGREFGKYIDIEQAKDKSPSFKKFIEIIDELLK